MGLFRKKEKVLNQDLSQKDNRPGMVFIIHLLMEDMCDMPEKVFMKSVMQKHFGEVHCFSHSSELAGFEPLKYSVHFEKDNIDAPPQLMVMKCIDIKKPLLDDIARSQLWSCKDAEQILSTCKYQVIASDMLAAGLDYKERAEMLVDYVEALVEMFPTCKAVLFENSKKMYSRDMILNCTVPKEQRFIYYAVNARFFNIQGTDDMLVDTLGMSTLFLPDLQYHFHGMDPNPVINHAYSMLTYIFANNNPIKPGDTIDGTIDGRISQDIQWRVQYEDALIQPARGVIDVNMGEFASGNR